MKLLVYSTSQLYTFLNIYIYKFQPNFVHPRLKKLQIKIKIKNQYTKYKLNFSILNNTKFIDEPNMLFVFLRGFQKIVNLGLCWFVWVWFNLYCLILWFFTLLLCILFDENSWYILFLEWILYLFWFQYSESTTIYNKWSFVLSLEM